MKVLSISRDKDKKIFEEGSAVRARAIEYGKKMQELHITVFVLKKDGLSKTQISNNVWVYPTNSLSRWFFVFDAIGIGKKIIREGKFEKGDTIITAQDPFECGYVGWSIAKTFGLPLHIQIHTDFLSPYFKTSVLQRIRVRTAKFLLPKADGVRVVSSRIADSIEKAGIQMKNSPTMLPIRVDVEGIEKSNKTDIRALFPQFDHVVLMASRLTAEKRIYDAVTAFKKVVIAHSKVGLLISGTGPELPKLKKLCEQLGASKNVVFLGFRLDIFSLMKSADIFLSTSEFEGYGMSLIEAGLAGCAVVSTDAGIAGGVLKDGLNSYVCPVGDSDCVAEKIIKLISDSATREIMKGRLASDVRATIPSPEEYVSKYVKDLESVKIKDA